MGDQERVLLHLNRPSPADQHSTLQQTIRDLNNMLTEGDWSQAAVDDATNTIISAAMLDNELLVLLTRAINAPEVGKQKLPSHEDYSPGVRGEFERNYDTQVAPWADRTRELVDRLTTEQLRRDPEAPLPDWLARLRARFGLPPKTTIDLSKKWPDPTDLLPPDPFPNQPDVQSSTPSNDLLPPDPFANSEQAPRADSVSSPLLPPDPFVRRPPPNKRPPNKPGRRDPALRSANQPGFSLGGMKGGGGFLGGGTVGSHGVGGGQGGQTGSSDGYGTGYGGGEGVGHEGSTGTTPQSPNEKDPGSVEKDPGGGIDPGGKDPGGKDPGGKDPGGKDPGGQDKGKGGGGGGGGGGTDGDVDQHDTGIEQPATPPPPDPPKDPPKKGEAPEQPHPGEEPPNKSGGDPNPDDDGGGESRPTIPYGPRHSVRIRPSVRENGLFARTLAARLARYGMFGYQSADDFGAAGYNPRFFGADPDTGRNTGRGTRVADPDSGVGGDDGGGISPGQGGISPGQRGGDSLGSSDVAAPGGPDPDNEWGASGYNPHYQPWNNLGWSPNSRGVTGVTRVAPVRVASVRLK